MKKKTLARRSPQGILAQSLGIRLTPAEQATVEQYASDEFLSRASFLRRLVLLGVQQYERDLSKK